MEKRISDGETEDPATDPGTVISETGTGQDQLPSDAGTDPIREELK